MGAVSVTFMSLSSSGMGVLSVISVSIDGFVPATFMFLSCSMMRAVFVISMFFYFGHWWVKFLRQSCLYLGWWQGFFWWHSCCYLFSDGDLSSGIHVFVLVSNECHFCDMHVLIRVDDEDCFCKIYGFILVSVLNTSLVRCHVVEIWNWLSHFT